jgi:hypothetical protein
VEKIMTRTFKYKTQVTPSGGSVVWNSDLLTGDLVSIHIKPTTDTTVYKLKIQDADGLLIYCTVDSRTGELAASYDGEVIDDILTFTLSDVTVDEEFEVVLRFRTDVRDR